MATCNLTLGNMLQRIVKEFWYLFICGSYVAITGYIKDLFINLPVIDIKSRLGKRTGQVVVMTGGTRGIGLGIVKKLLQLDYTIILGVQNMAVSVKRITEIRKLGITGGNVKLISLDLKSLDSVRQFANAVLTSKEGERIDMLVNNVIDSSCCVRHHELMVEHKTITRASFQVNYLSHFLLTNLLVSRMKETAAKKNEPCQIIYTSSSSQRTACIDFDELETTNAYSAAKRYGESKLCFVVHAKTLQKKFRKEGINIHCYACHPGLVLTDLVHFLKIPGFLLHLGNLILRSPDDAASAILYPALTREWVRGSSSSPPGNLIWRFLKQFWYFIICGINICARDAVKEFFMKAPVIEIEKLEKRSNQVVVMTGGPRGIGFDIVKKLLQLDYTVILGVRNIAASENGILEIRHLGITSGRVKFLNLDLKSLRSVRKFANEVLASTEGSRIDLLLNNAGIVSPSYEVTQDGYESIFQVNYLSHFLLTNLLLPRMRDTAVKKNESCHILNTSSDTNRGGSIDFNELETSKVYSSVKCYYDSKLCQVIHAKTLEKKLGKEKINIHAYSVHPGIIPTEIWNDVGCLGRFLILPVMKCICRTTNDAANAVLYPVLIPEVGGNCGGEYFENGKVEPSNPQANIPDIQERLWARSLELTRDSNSPEQGDGLVTKGLGITYANL
ncbi:Short-chain dehydrogenase TIC 32, chloroplastic [Orchesella cincta]|uniref:Short-chain dehydrogenase TIC 32, chloroplastic n=1 Tax=Orchesella cincta TaxID=48709 RepID=A0A1D2MR45_ORCCI|nr:Short-chain dehydrogenase TIC 32, chloroplastic [Orchesella cincta]